MNTDKKIRNCDFEFKFKCPKKWELLEATDSEDIKLCNQCNQKVYFCSSDEDALFHANQGHCIAIERPTERELLNTVIGEPNVDYFKLNNKKDDWQKNVLVVKAAE